MIDGCCSKKRFLENVEYNNAINANWLLECDVERDLEKREERERVIQVWAACN